MNNNNIINSIGLMDWGVILGLLGFLVGLVGVILALPGDILGIKKVEKNKKFYLVNGRSSLLNKENIMRIFMKHRPCEKYQNHSLTKEMNNFIRQRLKNKKNTLILGRYLSGKSRLVYEIIRTLNPPEKIYIIKTDINEDWNECQYPPKLLLDLINPLFKKQKKILIVDDLHIFARKHNFNHLLEIAIADKSTTMIVTCRSGTDYQETRSKLEEKNIKIDKVVNTRYNLLELPKRISDNDAMAIASKSGNSLDYFNGTIGSIYVRLHEMKDRYRKLEDPQKIILRSIKAISEVGMRNESRLFSIFWKTRDELKENDEKFTEITTFSLEDIKKTAERNWGLTGKNLQWNDWLSSLVKKEFIELETGGDYVHIEEAYIKSVIPEDY